MAGLTGLTAPILSGDSILPGRLDSADSHLGWGHDLHPQPSPPSCLQPRNPSPHTRDSLPFNTYPNLSHSLNLHPNSKPIFDAVLNPDLVLITNPSNH